MAKGIVEWIDIAWCKSSIDVEYMMFFLKLRQLRSENWYPKISMVDHHIPSFSHIFQASSDCILDPSSVPLWQGSAQNPNQSICKNIVHAYIYNCICIYVYIIYYSNIIIIYNSNVCVCNIPQLKIAQKDPKGGSTQSLHQESAFIRTPKES